MTTRIQIEAFPDEVIVTVEDDTGRDQVRHVPRYPRPGSERYVRFADALDVMMAGEEV